MLQQTVSFCEQYGQIVSNAIQLEGVCLNSSLAYVERSQERRNRLLRESIEGLLKTNKHNISKIFTQILELHSSKQPPLPTPSPQVASNFSSKTPSKPTSEVPPFLASHPPITNSASIKPIITNSNKLQYTPTIDSSNQKDKPLKLVTFKISQSDKQSKIMMPSVSQNVGCFAGFKNKLVSIVECDYCVDICGGENMKKGESYQIQGTEKEIKKMISNRITPRIQNK